MMCGDYITIGIMVVVLGVRQLYINVMYVMVTVDLDLNQRVLLRWKFLVTV